MVLNYWYLFFFLTFNLRHCVFSKPLRFKLWLFPSHVNPFDHATLYLWTISTEQLAYTLQTWQWFLRLCPRNLT
jgi:hypothetical protein